MGRRVAASKAQGDRNCRACLTNGCTALNGGYNGSEADYRFHSVRCTMAANIVSRITQIFRRSSSQNTHDDRPVGTTSGQTAAKTNMTLDLWQVADGRKSVWNDLERMYANDEYVARAIDIQVERCTGFTREEGGDKVGFYPQSDDPDVNDVLVSMVKRTGLDRQAADIIRWSLLYGMTPVEPVVVNDGGELRIDHVVQYLKSYQFFRNMENGRLKQGPLDTKEAGIAPYDQRNDMGTLVATFAPWQLVMFEHGAKGGRDYAMPILFSARKNWKRLQTLEDHMAIARMVRSYSSRVYEVAMAMDATEEEAREITRSFIENMTTREIVSWNSSGSSNKYAKVDSPLSVDTDIYVPKRYDPETGKSVTAEVHTIEGTNYQLWRLDDMEWSLRRLVAATKVPSKYLDVDLGRSTFSETTPDREEEQFEITLRGVQASFRVGIRALCDLELLLNGIDPVRAEYSIEMPRVSIRNRQRDAQTEEHYARSISMLAPYVTPEYLWDYYHQLNPEQRAAMSKAMRGQAADAAGEQSGVANPESFPHGGNGSNGTAVARENLPAIIDMITTNAVRELESIIA